MTTIKNPYHILGISPKASKQEIKKAYWSKAKELHPDANNPDIKNSLEFNDLSIAYRILNNSHARKLFDEKKIDFNGNKIKEKNIKEKNEEKKYRETLKKTKNSNTNTWSQFSSFKKPEFLSNLYKQISSTDFIKHKTNNKRGKTFTILKIPFEIAARGGHQELTLRDGNKVLIKVPAGIETGTIIRLREQGEVNLAGIRRDAMVRIEIENHKQLKRINDDIKLNLPISLVEAILGADIKIPTIEGQALLKIPKGANSGQILRLKGKGIKREKSLKAGDQLVELFLRLPKLQDPELKVFANQWSQRGYNPRQETPF